MNGTLPNRQTLRKLAKPEANINDYSKATPVTVAQSPSPVIQLLRREKPNAVRR